MTHDLVHAIYLIVITVQHRRNQNLIKPQKTKRGGIAVAKYYSTTENTEITEKKDSVTSVLSSVAGGRI